MRLLQLLLAHSVILAVLAAACYLPLRWSRHINLAAAACAGIGAYAIGVLTTSFGTAPALALGAGLLLGGGLGAGLGVIANRVKGTAVVVALLAVQLLVQESVYPLRAFTKGSTGIEGVKPLLSGGFEQRALTTIVLGIIGLGVAAVIIRWIQSSHHSLVLSAFGDDPDGLKRLGVESRRSIVVAFGVGGTLAALAGGLSAFQAGIVAPADIDLDWSVAGLTVALLAARLPSLGVGALFGSAAVVVGVRRALELGVASLADGTNDFFWQLHSLREVALAAFLLWLLMPSRRVRAETGQASNSSISPDDDQAHVKAAAMSERSGGPADPSGHAEESTNRAVAAGPSVTVREVQQVMGPTRSIGPISFDCEAGAAVAVTGPNGSGKTTLLKILVGLDNATSGGVSFGGGFKPEIGRNTGFLTGSDRGFPSLTAEENLKLVNANQTRQAIDSRLALSIDRLLQFDGSKGPQAASALSYGQRRRLALAMLLTRRHWPLLVMDEPTSGLDQHARNVLVGAMRSSRSSRATVLFAEHDLAFAQNVAMGAVALSDTDTPIIELLDNSGGTKPNSQPADSLSLLATTDLEAGYDGLPVVYGCSMEIRAGQVTFVAGRNGSGKTTLLLTLAALLRPIKGQCLTDLSRGAGGIAFVSESHLFDTRTVSANVAVAQRLASQVPMEPTGLLAIAAALADRRAGTLSLGERRLVRLAMALAQNPKILIVDEPSLHLAGRAAAKVATELVAIARSRGCALVVADHRFDIWLPHSDAVFGIDAGRCRPLIDHSRTTAGVGEFLAQT